MPEKVVDMLVTTPGVFSKLLTNSKLFISEMLSTMHLNTNKKYLTYLMLFLINIIIIKKLFECFSF